MKKVYGLLAHKVITLVLMAAPATPLIRAKTTLASTCKMVANACATVGDAKNATNPIAKPIAPIPHFNCYRQAKILWN